MKKIFKREKIFWAFISFSFLFLILSIGIKFFLGSKYLFNNGSFNTYIDNFVDFRNILISFLDTGNISIYDFNNGLGINILPNFIYLFGDLFSYVSVLFKEKDLMLLFEILIYIRLFFSGISFIIYSKYKNVSNYSSVIGAIIYTFSTFTIFFFSNNPYLFNLMILLPLLTICIEKIVLDNKKLFFIIISFLISFINISYIPYVFIYIILYSLILIFSKYRDYGIKLIFMAFLRVLLAYLVSVLLLGFILVPLFYLLRDNLFVVSNSSGFSFINMFLVYLVDDFDSIFMGINGISLLLLPLVFKKFKDNKFFIILIGLLYLLVILNNFSCVNTFGFIFLFIFSFLCSKTLDSINSITKSDVKLIISFVFINVLLSFWLNFSLNNFMVCLGAFFGYLLIILNKKELSNIFNRFNVYKLCFTLVLLFSSIYSISCTVIDSDLDEYNFERKRNVFNLDEEGFYRVNSSNNNNYSFSDNCLYKDLNIRFNNLDNRTKINSLLSNKYYLSDSNSYIPKYFDEVENGVYKNNYFVGLGSFYDKYIYIDDYNKLSSLEKESSLLKYVSLEKDDVLEDFVTYESNFKEKISRDIINLSFDVNIDISNNTFNIENDKLILSIKENEENGEVFLKINNLKGKDGTKIKVNYNDILIERELDDSNDLLLNLSHSRNIYGNVEIEFSNNGNYTYDSLELLVVNFASYKNEDVPNLNSIRFNVLEMNNDLIKAHVSSDKKGILQLSLNYDDFFKVYIDDKKVESLKVNKYFLGVYLDSGEHDIEIRYEMKGSNIGICISGVGLIVFCFVIFYDLKKKF